MALQSKILKLPAPSDSDESLDTTLCDLRFRALLPDDDWGRLPLATWRRFSKRLADGKTAIYVGEVVEVQFSWIGWWVAQLARLIGGPLPTCGYARRNGFPQVIHSSKRFSGPTGLEEYVGFGVSMALRMLVDGRALQFRSAGYFVQVGRLRLPLPALLTPGALTVTHSDCGSGEFRFTLEIIHPRFGTLIRQSAVFREATP